MKRRKYSFGGEQGVFPFMLRFIAEQIRWEEERRRFMGTVYLP